MTARNLNLYLLATRMTSAGAARREAILAVIGMEVNRKVVKSAGLGKILQLLRTNVRDVRATELQSCGPQRKQIPPRFAPRNDNFPGEEERFVASRRNDKFLGRDDGPSFALR